MMKIGPHAVTGKGPDASRRRKRINVLQIVHALAVGIFLFLVLIPIIFMITTSVKEPIEIREGGSLFPSKGIFIINWIRAYRSVPLHMYLFNSTVVAVCSASLALVVGVPASYVMVRHKFGGNLLPMWIMGTYIAPPIVFTIPIFAIIKSVGLVDNRMGLTIVHAVASLPVAVWLLGDFIRAVPLELEEAAWIDGASRYRTLLQVVVPVILPGLIATGIICGILSWNEFLYALVLTYSDKAQTFPIGISGYEGEHGLQFGEMSAGALTGILPVYILAFFFQRYLVQGLTRGSFK